jgi:DNA invertase Pin-like site-specific DNA recombinase
MSSADGARRAVAYIRLAEKRPELAEASADAPEGQRRAIEMWAERERIEIASWHVDVGIRGATPIAERPALVAAFRAIREYGAGILVAANADRFAHDELVSWLIERAALTERATLRTADGSRGPSRAPARVEAPEENVGWSRGALDLARAYRRVTVRARIRSSLAEKKARGERIGNVPYGYRLSKDGVHVEPDEAEQAVVSTVRRLSGEGLSQRAIVTQLKARGVAGRTGAPLRQTQIANILRSAS